MGTNWQEIATAFKNPDGSAFTGTLRVLVLTQLVTADGEIIGPDSLSYTVTAGQAVGGGPTSKAELPITEDTNPGNFALGLALIDANGRKRRLGEVVVPRPAGDPPYPAIDLTDILPVGST